MQNLEPLTAYTVSTEVTEETAPSAVVATLGLQPGERVIVRSRRFHVGDRPVQLAISYIPARIAAGTAIAQVDTGPGGMYARLTELGYGPVEFSEEIRARMPSPEEAGALNLPQGTPIIQISRRAATEDGTVVELNEMVLDAYAYILEYSFRA